MEDLLTIAIAEDPLTTIATVVSFYGTVHCDCQCVCVCLHLRLRKYLAKLVSITPKLCHLVQLVKNI